MNEIIINSDGDIKIDLTLSPTETIQEGTPTPESPVDVNVVKGNNAIIISNSDNTQSQNYSINLGNLEYAKIGDYEDEFIRTTGKNLFDKDNANLVQLIKASGGDYFVGSSGIKSFYIKVKPNTKYTIQKILSNRFNIYLSEEKPARNVAITTYVSRNTATSISITTGTNDNYLTVYFWVDSDTLTEQEILDTIMINEGEEMLPYEPYGANEWYLKENVDKITLNGTQTIGNINLDQENTTRITYISIINNGINTIPLLCNRLERKNMFNSDEEGIYYNTTNGNLFFRIKKTLIGTTTNEINTYLANNNIKVYFPVTSPIFKKITDTILIEQLENIHNNPKTYDNETIIKQINDGLPFDISYKLDKNIVSVISDINEFLRVNL